ncbi:hypothetical protein [Streptomyces sp. NPDC001948]
MPADGPEWGRPVHRATTRCAANEEDRRGLTALFWSNCNPYGTFRLDMDNRLELSSLQAAQADPDEGTPRTAPSRRLKPRYRSPPLLTKLEQMGRQRARRTLTIFTEGSRGQKFQRRHHDRRGQR